MAQTFKGFVSKIHEKHSQPGAKRKWTLYSTILKDEKGEDVTEWLSFGFDKPDVKEGDYVKVTVDTVEGRDKVVETKKLKNPPARTASASKKEEAAAESGPSKQSSIHYQNSRTAAIQAVALLVEADALGLPKAGTKPSEAKRYSIIVAAIDKLTIQYFNDLETMRLTETVADAGAISTEPDAELPEAKPSKDDEEEEEEESEEEEEDEDDED